MLSRIIIALLGGPILIAILYNGGYPLLIFTNLVIVVGTYEYYRMVEQSGKKPNKCLGMIFSLLLTNIIFLSEKNGIKIDTSSMISIFLIVCISVWIAQNRVKNASVDIGETLLGVIYVPLLFSHILLISFLTNGGKWLLTIQIMVWVCDSFAYFIGINLGRKIFKNGFSEISPKKSVEGSIGGLIFTVLSLFILNRYFILFQGEYYVLKIILLGILVGVIAQIGDLGESLFKREFGVKDSGKVLLGHGGVLDRFDSMLFVAPTTYYLIKLLIL